MKLFKSLMASSVILAAFSSGTVLANGHQNGMQHHPLTAATVNCIGHATDVCVVNYSNEYVYVTVPDLDFFQIPLQPATWVDAFSDYYYNRLEVEVDDDSGFPIFDQIVPNGSEIDISSDTAASKGKKLVAKLKVHYHPSSKK